MGWALFFCGKKGDFIMGTYNVHAGHCPQGKGASGAVGILQASVEDRIVKNEVIRLLEQRGIQSTTAPATKIQRKLVV